MHRGEQDATGGQTEPRTNAIADSVGHFEERPSTSFQTLKEGAIETGDANQDGSFALGGRAQDIAPCQRAGKHNGKPQGQGTQKTDHQRINVMEGKWQKDAITGSDQTGAPQHLNLVSKVLFRKGNPLGGARCA